MLTIFGIGGTIGLLIGIIVGAIFIFEIVMFVSAIRNQNISRNSKILWIIGMLLLHPFVAIAYFITAYKKL